MWRIVALSGATVLYTVPTLAASGKIYYVWTELFLALIPFKTLLKAVFAWRFVVKAAPATSVSFRTDQTQSGAPQGDPGLFFLATRVQYPPNVHLAPNSCLCSGVPGVISLKPCQAWADQHAALARRFRG